MSAERRYRRGARHGRAAVAGALVLAFLAGCGGSGADVVAVGPTVGDSGALAGLWRLVADGEPDGTILQLYGGDFTLIRPCLSADGTWSARAGLFLADMPAEPFSYGHKHCPPDPKVTEPSWVSRIGGYERDGDGWRLLARNGEPVATLRPGATFPAAADDTRLYGELRSGPGGRPGRAERARLNTATTRDLPAGVRPATAAELVGRWEPDLPASLACDRPYLELRADGTWAGHDDEHDQHGRWVLGADGIALGTAENSLGAACVTSGDTEPVPRATAVDAWMLRMARAGFRGDTLVLFDPDGKELADLTHRQPSADTDDVEHPSTAEPRDPRREGVAVPGGTKYLVRTAEHQFELLPFDVSPDFEGSDFEGILGIDRTDLSGVVVTGCAMGDVWLTVRTPSAAPEPLASAMDGWEVAEEETMTIRSPLSYVELFSYGAEEIFTPTEPGLHRVRLLAKGRALEYDHVCEEPVEHYELTIWPVDKEEPRVRVGDDGV